MITIDVPGAFETFLSGTGAVAGDRYSDDPNEERGAQELRVAYQTAKTVKRGKGHSVVLTLPSIDAAGVLASYAVWCLSSNYGGDKEYSEMAAARSVLSRIEKATEGRVRYDGWNVYLDGEKLT